LERGSAYKGRMTDQQITRALAALNRDKTISVLKAAGRTAMDILNGDTYCTGSREQLFRRVAKDCNDQRAWHQEMMSDG